MLEIFPPRRLLAKPITLPGSKSITNRAFLIAALCKGKSLLTGVLQSEDTHYMREALRSMGVKIREVNSTSFEVKGSGGDLQQPQQEIFLGNAGTAVRFLTAAATLVKGVVKIRGVDRMHARPIKDLTDALNQLDGVKIKTNKGNPPLTIQSNGKPFAKKIRVKGNISSQYVSALLMLLPLVKGETELILEGKLVSSGYTEITLKVMEAFGVKVKKLKNGFLIPYAKYQATKFAVEADASSATYFWAAEKLLKQKIQVKNSPKQWIQPDAKTHKIMQQFPKSFGKVNGVEFPDAIPTLAVLAAFARGESRFTGIENLRVKECDRIHAVATELNKIQPGIAREVGDDLVIRGNPKLAEMGKAAEIETYGDHRIAMSFTLAGLRVKGIKIINPKCVEKSFPNFFSVWESLGVKTKTTFNRNIVLIGMRGSGKSSIGRRLAKKLKWKLIDLDKEIEKEMQMPITELVKLKGWEVFRNFETRAAHAAATKNKVVIATGGGVILRKENVSALKKTGVMVLLNVPIEELKARVARKDTRPSLTGKSPAEELGEIWQQRKKLYLSSADTVVSFKSKTKRKKKVEVLEAVEKLLG